VNQAGDEQRLKFHLNAIFVSNFSNHLYALSEKFCAEEKLDFSLLKPLIKRNCQPPGIIFRCANANGACDARRCKYT